MKWFIVFLFAAGCSPALITPVETAGPVLPAQGADTCDGRHYHTLVGQRDTVLEKILILRQVRVIRPGDLITQDYRPERINFHIAPSALISQISCG